MGAWRPSAAATYHRDGQQGLIRRAAGGRGGRRHATTAVLLALVMAVPVGCGGRDAGTPPPAPVSPSAGTPPAPPQHSPSPASAATRAEQRALAAYEGMWTAYDQAGRAPQADPDDPRLEQHAAGRALQVLVSGLQRLRERGEVIDGAVELDPQVVEVIPAAEPVEVEIEDCGDSSGWLTVDAATGEVSDEPRGRQRVYATVRDTGGGQWKVVDFAVLEVGSCG